MYLAVINHPLVPPILTHVLIPQREIYLNSQYVWTADPALAGTRDPITGKRFYDFPSVALHEMGHAMGADHFGNIGFKFSTGLTASPRAIMNAIYKGAWREITGHDEATMCNQWARFGKK